MHLFRHLLAPWYEKEKERRNKAEGELMKVKAGHRAPPAGSTLVGSVRPSGLAGSTLALVISGPAIQTH